MGLEIARGHHLLDSFLRCSSQRNRNFDSPLRSLSGLGADFVRSIADFLRRKRGGVSSLSAAASRG